MPGGEVKSLTIAVGPETVNHTMPLCFDPNPKDFSSLKSVKVTTISDLINDKGIEFSLIKFDCSPPSIISKADETGVSAGVIIIIVIICLLIVAMVGFCLYVYFVQPPTIVKCWNNITDTLMDTDPEIKGQSDLPLLEGQTDSVVPVSVDVTSETNRNRSMKPGKEESNDEIPLIKTVVTQNDEEKPIVKTVITIKDNVLDSSTEAINEGDSNAVTKPDSQMDKVHQIISDTNSDKEKGINSNSDKKVQNEAVPKVISKAAQENDLDLKKKQLERIEQLKAKKATKERNSPINKDKVNASDDNMVTNPINNTNVVNNYYTNVTVVGTDAGISPLNYTNEKVVNTALALPDEDIDMVPQWEVDNIRKRQGLD